MLSTSGKMYSLIDARTARSEREPDRSGSMYGHACSMVLLAKRQASNPKCRN